MGRVGDWLRRKVRDPLLAELRQGATPEAVSAAVTVSLAIAINPFIGTTTLGCLVAGRQDAVATAEPPWLMHPVEHGTLKHFNNVSLLFSSHQLIN